VAFRRLLLPVASTAEPDFVFGMVIFPTAAAVPATQNDDESVDLQVFATDADLALDESTDGGRAGQA
jgi:hypothetical protein